MTRKLLTAVLLLTAHVFCLDIPSPVRGVPNFSVGKGISIQAGSASFYFSPPPGWGMGECLAKQEGPSHFALFPQEGGIGCTVQIVPYQDEAEANNAAEELQKAFSNTKSILRGFEAELKRAWYACYVNESYLIQIWYSLPKISSHEAHIWEQLKQCVTLQKKEETKKNENLLPIRPLFSDEKVFHSPNNHLYVLFKSRFSSFPKEEKTQDVRRNYLLEVNENDNPLLSFSRSSGFFYIKWDQKDLETFTPYKTHLSDMKGDILQIESSQKFEKKPVFMNAEKWAFLRGNPYTLISVAGDGFLFGFALKSNRPFGDIDFTSYIQRVSWWEN